MTIDEIKDLKDKIYEIEGLLELAQLREDKIPELEPLILGRIKSLLEEKGSVVAVAADRIADSLATDEDTLPMEDPAALELTVVNSISELFEESEMKSVSRPVEELEMQEISKPDDSLYSETADIKKPNVTEEKRHDNNEVKKHKLDKPAFCLNDRFRFKRELFGNSDAEFSSAMDMIAAMDNYDEAEEYFIGELEWDAENPEVVDFMEIIKGYFEA